MDNIQILDIKSVDTYDPILFNQPKRIIAKVNGTLCDYTSNVSPSLQEDLECYGIYKSNEDIMDMLKEEAGQWYHDNIREIRKQKIQKIENYEWNKWL